MIRDIFNVCVALALSARARQIFGRILWRHRTVIAMAASAAVPVIVMLIPVGYHENAPVRPWAFEWYPPPTEVEVINSGTGAAFVTTGSTGQILVSNYTCYAGPLSDEAPVWATVTLTSGTSTPVTLSSTNSSCSVR